MIRLKRVYESRQAADGKRFLVERLWPRGVRKDALPMDGWLRDVAPSPELRSWFGHRPDRWAEFQLRYRQELEASSAWQPLADAARTGDVTLLFSARDVAHNAAAALKAFLEDRLHDA